MTENVEKGQELTSTSLQNKAIGISTRYSGENGGRFRAADLGTKNIFQRTGLNVGSW